MYEDEQCNSMIDSIELFNEICNLRWFATTAMILFLNKQDEFAKRIQQHPLTVCFPEYDGINEYEPCIEFIKHQFESQNSNPKDKPIYTHVTLATDKNNVERVFSDVQHIVINTSLVNGLSTFSFLFLFTNFLNFCVFVHIFSLLSFL
ncbi:G-protein subunit alpha 1 [Reticulomyxa filosa]|uniref:G-protein subunit alpha 1 n=1 Tax=Reticulomyxa filosa TaxID=46433 RepID=X6P8Z7_RETFI|nr:G-protein subunit alpha 1 [Reticulomyxa filosa]|eukprot:ETO34666.1 G-protein subunit alpha 1 [Reticulomyxa filosa]